ncbi:MAG TPA: bifunctional 3-(3-hydroxy-phenyl)propionate/3-hydroxycinnamic acid hydroxylase [Steroidobacteraceae bacterium]|nr:bifunctional 3-(3-hydroxy-phenyl)propionate/3-hydroxycinnamic acid hydroxylase [Steroidobacteraceae bacterium]
MTEVSSVQHGDEFDADVLIVGLGPTGATAAGLLAQRGLSVLAFDRLPGLYPVPRAVGLDHEVMRIMQELAVADRLAPYIEPYSPSEYRGMQGQVIKRLDAVPPPFRMGWAPNYVFNQPAFENEIRRRLSELPRVRLEFPVEVIAVGQDSDHVWADVKDVSGRKRRVTAAYLLACDGGSSPIRKSLGIELEDLGFDEPWLVVDVMVSDEKANELPQTQVQYCEAGRPATFVKCTGNHRRWEIMLLPGDSLSADFPEAELWPLLSRWIKPHEGKLWRAAAYRFHGLVAKEWRRGRILLGGDSVHMTPPFMAQGMVQGIRDAHNLAWKLARVIRGRAPVRLLDSYQIERRPHVEVTTRAAIELGQVICERDPQRAHARDEALLTAQGGQVKTTFRQSMIPNLRRGFLAEGSPGAGALFPQPVVSEERSGRSTLLDDLTGSRVRVIAATTLRPQEAAAFGKRLAMLDGCLVALSPAAGGDVCVRDTSGCLESWMSDLGCSFVIVRPDHYVYATATSVTDALCQLDSMCGELQLR